jgi:hypothetical protein
MMDDGDKRDDPNTIVTLETRFKVLNKRWAVE